MFFVRILSIMIKVKMGEQIGLKEGEVLNVNKKMTKRLFDNWARNPVELTKSKMSEGSEHTITKVQKPQKATKKRKVAELKLIDKES